MRSIIIFVLLALVIFLLGCTAKNSVEGVLSLEEKLSSGSVNVGLLPESYGKGVLSVGYSFDTHSVELSAINLQAQVTLYMDGKEVKPSNSPSLSGHHAEGVLEFRVDEVVFPLRIVVLDVPDVAVREFVWDVP